jgi:ubiquinone biosynthesis protein
VLRPNVRALCEGDGQILRFWARLFELVFDRAAHAELAAHLEQFMLGILEQTDLRIEAQNYERFRKNFRRVKKVRFPKVYEDLSGERVLVMEFVRGKKVDEIERGEFPDLPQRLREAFLKMAFEDGFLHADLHPGNFVIEPNGTIVIFDVGLAKALSEELLEYYIDFNRCLAMGDVEDFMHHLRTYHRDVDGTVDWVELENDIRRFHDDFRVASAKDLEMGQLIDAVFATGRKHGVRPIAEMTLMMVGVVTAEGIGKMLDPDVNSFQELSNFLLPVLARRNMLTPKLMEAAAAMSARLIDRTSEPPAEVVVEAETEPTADAFLLEQVTASDPVVTATPL